MNKQKMLKIQSFIFDTEDVKTMAMNNKGKTVRNQGSVDFSQVVEMQINQIRAVFLNTLTTRLMQYIKE
jgi:hypothetical protein